MEFLRECADAESMQAFGAQLAGVAGVIGLDGELGAGKTELVKGVARACGFEGVVSSPTFALLQEYRCPQLVIYHLDFYRVESAEEVLSLGWDELLDEPGSLVIVEWASRFPELLPGDALRLQLEILPSGVRRITSVVS